MSCKRRRTSGQAALPFTNDFTIFKNTCMPPAPTPVTAVPRESATQGALVRISSSDLMQSMREIEIEHGGRIYRLRITSSNKLILTA
jgi:hemin uptake protein HemP